MQKSKKIITMAILTILASTAINARADFIDNVNNDARAEFEAIGVLVTALRNGTKKTDAESGTVIVMHNQILNQKSTGGAISLALMLSEYDILEQLIILQKNKLLSEKTYLNFFSSNSLSEDKKSLQNSDMKKIEVIILKNGLKIKSTISKNACDYQLNIIKVLVDSEIIFENKGTNALAAIMSGKLKKIDGEFHNNYILDYIKVNSYKFTRKEINESFNYDGYNNLKAKIINSYYINNGFDIEGYRKAQPKTQDYCDLYDKTNDSVEIEYSVIQKNN